MAETTHEFSLVCQSDIVFADPGDTVVLSCHLEPAISAGSMEIKWKHKADLVCHYKHGHMTECGGYEGRVLLSLQNLQTGNVSLTLKDVQGLHRGLYICEVIHEQQTKKEYVFLHVSFQNLILVVPTGTIYANQGEDVTLPVHISPETSATSMTVIWERWGQTIYKYKNREETSNRDYENRVSLIIQELQRGNISLTLRNVQPSDSGNYKCILFWDGYCSIARVHLQVREIKKSNHRLRRLQHLNELIREMDYQQKLEKLQQQLACLEKALKDLEHNDNGENRNKISISPTSRRTNSMEWTPPSMEDYTQERQEEREHLHTSGPTSRRTNSMEWTPPSMEIVISSQETQGGSGTTNQVTSGLGSLPSNTGTQERPEATTQRGQVSTATEQETSAPATQPHGTTPQLSTSAAGAREQTQARRRQQRPGRREDTEKNCLIL